MSLVICHLLHPAVEQLTVQPIKTISGTVKLPGSKSLSNRILLLAALAEGTTIVRNLLVRGWLDAATVHSCAEWPYL
jgi:5-enolpyruvylshikimate-3-phosphate synthase